MKFRISLILLLIATVGVQAQGILFTRLTLDQALEKARKEHKNVFINCCMRGGKPCIEMDNVFPDKAVGDFYNKHYVCIRVNMEELPVDDMARAERALADTIRRRYHVNGYPNMLFLDSKGKLLHRNLGAMDASAFVELGKAALDPAQQHYTQIETFRRGKYDSTHLRQLAMNAFNFGESEVARDMAHTYLRYKSDNQLANPGDMALYSFVLQDKEKVGRLARQYWDGLSVSERLRPENMRMLTSLDLPEDTLNSYLHKYLQQSSDAVLLQKNSLPILVQASYVQGSKSESYRYLWEHRQRIDSVFGQYLSLIKLFSRFMSAEQVMPFLKQSQGVPDWAALQTMLAGAYDAEYAQRVLLQTQLGYNMQQKNWPISMQLLVKIDQLFGASRAGYEISQELAVPLLTHSSDTALLGYALQRMKNVVEEGPTTGQVQVYAMLLYNTGQQTAAIHWETIAKEAAPDDKNISTNLAQMIDGTLNTLQP